MELTGKEKQKIYLKLKELERKSNATKNKMCKAILNDNQTELIKLQKDMDRINTLSKFYAGAL